jgi:hypothetical protein
MLPCHTPDTPCQGLAENFAMRLRAFTVLLWRIITPIGLIPQDSSSNVFSPVVGNQKHLSKKRIFLRQELLEKNTRVVFGAIHLMALINKRSITRAFANIVGSAVVPQPEVYVKNLHYSS